MGVDLCLCFHTAVYQTECRNCPVKIFFVPVTPAQRKLLTERRLVNLDHTDTVCLKIEHLIPNGKCDLIGAFL